MQWLTIITIPPRYLLLIVMLYLCYLGFGIDLPVSLLQSQCLLQPWENCKLNIMDFKWNHVPEIDH